MISDSVARNTALDPQRSFIVQAPAGSGKTGLLVYRLLRLLAQAEQPQEVLAITFTRKATSEMNERLLSLLNAAQAGTTHSDPFEQQGIDLAHQVLAQDAKKNWQLLDAPQQLQILTIDAFCAKLTGSMPWLSRLGDRPHTTDNAEKHYQVAVERLLNEMLGKDHELITQLKTVLLALDYNYSRVRNLLSSMLAKREQWLRHLLSANLAEQRQTIEAAWQAISDAHLNKLNRVFDSASLQTLTGFAQLAASRLPTDSNTLAVFLEPSAQQEPSTLSEKNQLLSLEHWRALRFLLLMANGQKLRSSVNKNQGFPADDKDSKTAFLTFLSQYADDTELIDLLEQVKYLPSGTFTDQDWQQLLAIEQVLKSLAARLQLRFRATGECDHSEVAQRANLALLELDNPTDLGLRLDCQIQHILVDEFQDTSHGQVQLLKRLTLGWDMHDTPAKTLFLVGDPMQSIYRFREADVSLFLQVANNDQTQVFENIDIEPLTLSENFRSSHAMVDWFNRVFKNSFADKSDDLLCAVSYSPATSSKDSGSQTSSTDRPVQCLLSFDKAQQSELIVSAVNQAIQTLPKPEAQVAILVRTRGHLSSVLPALQDAGIAYAGVDIQPLASLQAVIDLLALCKAICRLDDRVSWLAILRGPWCGLSLLEIKQLASAPDRTIWESISVADLSQFSGESQARLKRLIAILQKTLAQKHQVDLASLLRWAWQQLGGPVTLLNASMDDMDAVFDLISEHQNCGDITSIKELDAALEGLYAQPSNDTSGQTPRVVVSTMHKSKGLQYDTVILPSLSSPARSDDKEILMWSELPASHGATQLLLAPMYLKPKLDQGQGLHYAYLRELEKRRAAHEAERLIYVACTRAERKLVLLGVSGFVENTQEQTVSVKPPPSNSLLAKIWPSVEAEFDFPLAEPVSVDQARVYPQTLFRLPSDYTPNFRDSVAWAGAQQLNASEAELNDKQHEEIEYQWAQQVATGVGVVLHNWLQYNSDKVLSTEIDDVLLQRWRAELTAQRVPDKHIDFGVERIARGVRNIQTDTDAHFIFAEYPVAFNEYALAYVENGIVKRHRLDRTFVDNSGVRWVVDYKTTDTQAEDIVSFADQQLERHRSQLEKYGELISELDDAPIQLAVYFPLLQLRSWRYQKTV